MTATARQPRSTPGAALLHPASARNSRPLPGPAIRDDTLDTAFQLGWDHARHGVVPPLETLCGHARLRQGFRAGRATFGRHTRPADRRVQLWLALRLQALRQRLAFETEQLTPHFLGQLEATHCPVTRERLCRHPGAPHEGRIARLRLDAGFAAGHLAMVSARALAARGRWGLNELLARARTGEAGELDAFQWGRWATLCSFVVPLPHGRAAALPLRVLPPNRLQLFNPVQALQTLASRALQHRTPNRRLASLRNALPAQALRAFDAWLRVYQTEVQVRGRETGRQAEIPAHWVLEDAWQSHEVQRHWRRFAARLEPGQCERIALHGGEGRTAWRPEGLATEGWALENAGQTSAGTRLRTVPELRSFRQGSFFESFLG